jgi:hypothetical protein
MIPVYEWYDHDVHLMSLENVMKSPEFKKQADNIKNAFVFHRQAHTMAKNIAMQKAAMLAGQMQVQAGMAAQAGAASAGGGTPPPGAGDGPPGTNPELRPQPPNAPRGAVPGGHMPTALAH